MRDRLMVLVICGAAALGLAGPASAGPANPGLAGATLPQAVAPQGVRWVCDDGRCVWRPHSRVRVPVYAQSWGPPPRPSCSYVLRRGPQGQALWEQVCR